LWEQSFEDPLLLGGNIIRMIVRIEEKEKFEDGIR